MPTVSPQLGGVFDPTRDVSLSGNLQATGTIRSSGATGVGGIGYDTGAGASVTQITSRSTAVTCNGLCGRITTDSTSLAAEAAASFTVNNSAVAIGDVVVVSQRSGAIGVMTDVVVIAVSAGAFVLAVMNGNVASGTAETGAIVLNFAVIKAVST